MKNFNTFKEIKENKEVNNEIIEHTNKVGDMDFIMKQLKDYIKPGDGKSGYDATIKKSGNTITISKGDNYVKVKDNGLPNNFYTIELKDKDGKHNEGDENAAENVLVFVGNTFDKSNGLDKTDNKLK